MAKRSHILGLRLSVCNNSRADDRICNAWQRNGFTVEAYQLGQFKRRVYSNTSTRVCLHLERNSVNTVSLLSFPRAWQVYRIENNLHVLEDNRRGTTQYFLRPRNCRNRNMSWRINPLNPELNPVCHLLALLGAHHFLHVSRIRVKSLTLRLLMSYIYGAPILDVSRSHTTMQHSR